MLCKLCQVNLVAQLTQVAAKNSICLPEGAIRKEFIVASQFPKLVFSKSGCDDRFWLCALTHYRTQIWSQSSAPRSMDRTPTTNSQF